MRSSSQLTSASRTTGRCSRRTAGRGCGATSKASTATTTASRIRRSARCSTSRPMTSPTRQIGVPQFGYLGDIRFLGKLGAGLLPNDRTHQVKVYGTYNLPVGLNFGAGVNLSSGQPLTQMAANPNYNSAGRNSDDRARRGLSDGGRIQEADADGSERSTRTSIGRSAVRAASTRPAHRRVQSRQPAAR